jgi:hypothetical protein
MLIFINILSCVACFYMYNKSINLQRKIDFLEYEMVMLTTFIYNEKTLLKNLIKYKEE